MTDRILLTAIGLCALILGFAGPVMPLETGLIIAALAAIAILGHLSLWHRRRGA